MIIGEQLGAETFYSYLQKFAFDQKTGIDLPGEAAGIMYKPDKTGPVELATMAFGQSLTITPLQLVRAAAATINGGYLVTPHIGTRLMYPTGEVAQTLTPALGQQILPTEVSDTMRFILESVVAVGTGQRTYIPGLRVGGKTATSQKLPRGSGKYISSIMAFAPADNPQVVALVLVDEPQGTYYGGQVTGPIMQVLLENTLPYLGVMPVFNEVELQEEDNIQSTVPDVRGESKTDATRMLQDVGLGILVTGEGGAVRYQFPKAGELVNRGEDVLVKLGE